MLYVLHVRQLAKRGHVVKIVLANGTSGAWNGRALSLAMEMPHTPSCPEQQAGERKSKYLQCKFARISNTLSQMNVQHCKTKISAKSSHILT